MQFSKKGVFWDIALNLVSTAMPLIVVQLIINPYLSRTMSDAGEYGLMLTLYSVFLVASQCAGNALNNVRLITAKIGLNRHEAVSDFNRLVLLGGGIALLATVVGTFYYNGSLTTTIFFLTVLLSFGMTLRAFLVVEFCIALNYKNILFCNVYLALGYLLGIGIYQVSSNWHLIFITGELFSSLYLLRHTNVLLPFTPRSSCYLESLKKYIVLASVSVLKNLSVYLDKLLLYPILGGSSVAVLFASSVMGKIMMMATGPVSGVLLSYYAKMESFSKKLFLKMMLITCSCVIAMGFVVYVLSQFVLLLLYPTYAEQALAYVPIMTVIYAVRVLDSMVNPLILRFYSVHWQTVLGGTELFCSVFLSLLFMFMCNDALLGYCIGILIAVIIIVALKIMIFLFTKPTPTSSPTISNKKELI